MIRILVVAALAVGVALAVLSVVLGWRSVGRSTSSRTTLIPRVLLTLASASYLWFLALLAFAPVIAPDYSNLRFRTIYLNIAFMLVTGVVSGVRGGQARTPLVWATGLLVVLWSYLAV